MNSFEQKTFLAMTDTLKFKRILVKKSSHINYEKFKYFAFFEINNNLYSIYDVFSNEENIAGLSFSEIHPEIVECKQFITKKLKKISNKTNNKSKKFIDDVFYFIDEQLEFFLAIYDECIDEKLPKPVKHDPIELKEIITELIENEIPSTTIYQEIMKFYEHDRKSLMHSKFKSQWIDLNESKSTPAQKRNFG